MGATSQKVRVCQYQVMRPKANHTAAMRPAVCHSTAVRRLVPPRLASTTPPAPVAIKIQPDTEFPPLLQVEQLQFRAQCVYDRLQTSQLLIIVNKTGD
jgi:hypothetical protein